MIVVCCHTSHACFLNLQTFPDSLRELLPVLRAMCSGLPSLNPKSQ